MSEFVLEIPYWSVVALKLVIRTSGTELILYNIKTESYR